MVLGRTCSRVFHQTNETHHRTLLRWTTLHEKTNRLAKSIPELSTKYREVLPLHIQHNPAFLINISLRNFQNQKKKDLTVKPRDFIIKRMTSQALGSTTSFTSLQCPTVSRYLRKGRVLFPPRPVVPIRRETISSKFMQRARLDTVISKYPAANAYTLPSCFVSKKDFSNSCSSMFQLPNFAKGLKFETPAPNQYNASASCCEQRNNVSARAGFLSKTQRGVFINTENGPAPGYYNINESLVKQSPKILVSCFRSKTGRGLKLTSIGPGPGSYNLNEHIKIPKKTLIPFQVALEAQRSVSQSFPSSGLSIRHSDDSISQANVLAAIGMGPQNEPDIPLSPKEPGRRHPILNFSTQPLSQPLKPPLPGPGQYEIVDYTGPPKRLISSASFVSNTRRWTAAPTQPDLPGPATYKPEFPGKQSFLYNEDNKWIPVL